MTPYFQHGGITIYNADARDVLPTLEGIDAILTDPVWPNNRVPEFASIDPVALLSEVLENAKAERLVIHLGCDSDPRILTAVPARWPFFRVCWLEYACPTRKGRVLYTGDVAYSFGRPVKSAPGRRVISGKYVSTKPDADRVKLTAHKDYGKPVPGLHPTPRRLQHCRWVVSRFADGLICDPFAGSGTYLLAAKLSNLPAVGIEIKEQYCEIAAKRLDRSGVLDLVSGYEFERETEYA